MINGIRLQLDFKLPPDLRNIKLISYKELEIVGVIQLEMMIGKMLHELEEYIYKNKQLRVSMEWDGIQIKGLLDFKKFALEKPIIMGQVYSSIKMEYFFIRIRDYEEWANELKDAIK